MFSLFFLIPLIPLLNVSLSGASTSHPVKEEMSVGEKRGQDERGQDYQKLFILGGRERKDKNLRRRVNFKRAVWDFRGTDYVILK